MQWPDLSMPCLHFFLPILLEKKKKSVNLVFVQDHLSVYEYLHALSVFAGFLGVFRWLAAGEREAGEESHHGDEEEDELHSDQLCVEREFRETGDEYLLRCGSVCFSSDGRRTYAWLVNNSKPLALRSDKATNPTCLRAVRVYNYTVDGTHDDKEDTSNDGKSVRIDALHAGLQPAIVAGAE